MLILVKIVSALLLTLMTLWVIRWPRVKPARAQVFWDGCGYAAKGIFLGLGLMHMLPEAVHHAQSQAGDAHSVYRIAAFTFLGLWLLEQGLAKYMVAKVVSVQWLVYWLLMLMGWHAFTAGFALGGTDTLLAAVTIMVALFAHKGAEAFALGVEITKAEFGTRYFYLLATLFSLMTPFGIAAGMLSEPERLAHSGFEAIFEAVAAGTFFYLSLTLSCQHRQGLVLFKKVLYFGLGLGLIVVIYG